MRNTSVYTAITLVIIFLNRVFNAMMVAEESLNTWDRAVFPQIASVFAWAGLVVMVIVFYFHFQSLLEKGLQYDSFVAKRESYVFALNEARTNGRELEALDILKDTIIWNNKLVDKQINLRHYFNSEYVDQRFATLKPIT